MAMAREVIGMGVGNEGGFPRVPGIQPEIQLGQMDSPVENDFNHAPMLTACGHAANPSREPAAEAAPGISYEVN